jgi:hypothetical protein
MEPAALPHLVMPDLIQASIILQKKPDCRVKYSEDAPRASAGNDADGKTSYALFFARIRSANRLNR